VPTSIVTGPQSPPPPGEYKTTETDTETDTANKRHKSYHENHMRSPIGQHNHRVIRSWGVW
jgi:hypothetical protein